MTDNFFDKTSNASKIKSKIVTKYFFAWATIMSKRSDRICYVDFFSGPGRYNDGTPSTPLQIMEKVCNDNNISKRIIAKFIDKNASYIEKLRTELNDINGIRNLVFPPTFDCSVVDKELAISLQEISTYPMYAFIDPFGYKGLSRKLINAIIKNWGSEITFFFNYQNINRFINVEKVEDHMSAIFGKTRLEDLSSKISKMSPYKREAEVIETLHSSIKEIDSEILFLPFRFQAEKSERTSHYLVHLTKNKVGYKIMKDVMALASTEEEQGVSNFSYIPAQPSQQFLFGFNQPLDDLQNELLNKFQEKSMSVSEIYDIHNIGTNYRMKNYKDALKILYEKNEVNAYRENGKPITRGFPEDIIVKFPKRSK